jgi:hypothetical protein
MHSLTNNEDKYYDGAHCTGADWAHRISAEVNERPSPPMRTSATRIRIDNAVLIKIPITLSYAFRRRLFYSLILRSPLVFTLLHLRNRLKDVNDSLIRVKPFSIAIRRDPEVPGHRREPQ